MSQEATQTAMEPQEEKGAEMDQEQITQALFAKIVELTAKVEQLTSGGKKAQGVKKNHVPSKPSPTRTYVRLSDHLADWGRVPQQQADIAKIIIADTVKGVPVTEAFMFDLMLEKASEYPSLANSTQSPDYLFRYYRGLKNDGKHAGFVARKFLQVID